jgi:hypothetical protein
MSLVSVATDGERTAVDALTRKSFLAIGLAAAASSVAAPTALASAEGDSVTAKRLARLRSARERVVAAHGRAENNGDLDKTLGTFTHPHEEVIPLGWLREGADAVHTYYADAFKLFPDQQVSDGTLRHADCAVIAEFMLSGTMKGPLGSIPATNKGFKLRGTALFLFAPNTAKLMGERIYFDLFSLFQQIGVLQAIVDAGAQFPAGGGIAINRREPGVKVAAT